MSEALPEAKAEYTLVSIQYTPFSDGFRLQRRPEKSLKMTLFYGSGAVMGQMFWYVKNFSRPVARICSNQTTRVQSSCRIIVMEFFKAAATKVGAAKRSRRWR